MSVKFVWPDGPSGAKVMIVGEAPGKEEEKQGIPFVGRSGKLLNKVLEELGIKREEVYVTNIVKVRPANNRTPTQEEMSSWIPLLEQEIKNVRPHIIVPLGNCATQVLLGKNVKITEYRGSTVVSTIGGARNLIMPAFHPSYILRNKNKYDIFKEDLKRATEVIRNDKQGDL